MLKLALASATCALTLMTGVATAGNHTLQNVDAYLLDLAAAARAAPRAQATARISDEMTSGHFAQVDPRMGKSTFVWAGASEPIAVVGPLTPDAMIDARARIFLRNQSAALGLTPQLLEQAVLFDAQDLGHGPLIARYEQYVDGVQVFKRSLNVMLNRQGRPVAASGYFATDFDLAQVRARSFALAPAAAIRAAIVYLGGSSLDYAFSALETRGDYQIFSARPLNADILFRLNVAPRVKRVYFPRLGTLEPGYYVELQGTRAGAPRFAQAFVISAVDGALLARNDQMAYEAFTYRVWADASGSYALQPYEAPLGTGYMPFPGGTNRDAPVTRVGAAMSLVTLNNAGISTNDPWVAAGATETLSNHVDACLDIFDTPVSGVVSNPTNTCNPELGDERGKVSSPGKFDYEIQADSDPKGTNGPEAAVVSLFYMNNWLHDWWYDHGFNEAARNAQTNNFGRGGTQGDPVKAQGQDASGRNNANMSTPADGSSPTMQQYLFDGFVKGVVKETIPAGPNLVWSAAVFGAQTFDVTAAVGVATETDGVAMGDGCGTAIPDPAGTGALPTPPAAAQSNLSGKIALVNRGNCNFTTKAQFAASSGAVALLVVNNSDADPIPMGNGDSPVDAPTPLQPTDPAYTLPAVMIRKADGTVIRGHIAAGGSTMQLKRVESTDQDGTIDNQIVGHEYFHYVSNRLVGNSSGLGNQQGGGMGEGWGDISALMLSVRDDDRLVTGFDNSKYQGAYPMGWYVYGTMYAGIRRAPYSTDPVINGYTFKNIQDGTANPDGSSSASNSEVHNTGEIWANMFWNCYAGILNVPGNDFFSARSRMKDYLIAGMKMTPSDPTFTEARDGILAAALATDYEDFAACARGYARRGAGVYAVSPPRDSTDNVGVTESPIALVGRYKLTRVDFIPDQYCDIDGILDSGESGMLALTIRNDGTWYNPQPLAGVVTTTNSAVTLSGGGAISLPPLFPGESTTLTLGVSAGTFAGSKVSVPLSIDLEPIAPGDVEVEDAPVLNTSFFAHHDGGYRNTDDMTDTATSNGDWTRGGTGAAASAWALKTGTATQSNGQSWFVGDPATTTNFTLTTPEFSVPSGGTLSLEFVHQFAFESGYDGGVIEVQVDGGAWANVTAAGGTFAQGAAYNDATVAAFNNGPAFTGNRAKETMVVSFGTALAGHNARIRFRAASDDTGAGTGWYIDDVKLNGISRGVFTYLVDENGVCVTPISADAGVDITRPEHPANSSAFSTVTLAGSVNDSNVPKLAVGYEWHQVGGTPTVTLTNASSLTPSFTAPAINADTTLEFQLVVSGAETGLPLDTDEVFVTLTNVNLAPSASAGSNQNVDEGTLVTLEGAAADQDPDDTVTLLWKQTLGPSVTLSDATVASPTFTAPETEGETILAFTLTADDGHTTTTSSPVIIAVRNTTPPTIGNNAVGGLAPGALSLLAALAALRRRRRGGGAA